MQSCQDEGLLDPMLFNQLLAGLVRADYQLRETMVEETERYVSCHGRPCLQSVSISTTTTSTTTTINIQKKITVRPKPCAQLDIKGFLYDISSSILAPSSCSSKGRDGRLQSPLQPSPSRRSDSIPNKDDGAAAISLCTSKRPKQSCRLYRLNIERRRCGQGTSVVNNPEPRQH